MAPKHCGYRSQESYDIMRSFKLLDKIRAGEINPPHDSVAYDKWAKKNKIYLSQSELRAYMAGKTKVVKPCYDPVANNGVVEMSDVFAEGLDFSENIMKIVRCMSMDSPVSLDKFNWVPANAKVDVLGCVETVGYQEIGNMAFLAYQYALRKGSVAMMRPEHGPNKEV